MNTMNDQPSTRNAIRLTTEQVWDCLERASFAVVSYSRPRAVTLDPGGIVYKAMGDRLFVAVAPDSWKARHIAVIGRVCGHGACAPGRDPLTAVPHPPRRWLNFHGAASVHAPGSPTVAPFLKELGSLLPLERRTAAALGRDHSRRGVRDLRDRGLAHSDAQASHGAKPSTSLTGDSRCRCVRG